MELFLSRHACKQILSQWHTSWIVRALRQHNPLAKKVLARKGWVYKKTRVWGCSVHRKPRFSFPKSLFITECEDLSCLTACVLLGICSHWEYVCVFKENCIVELVLFVRWDWSLLGFTVCSLCCRDTLWSLWSFLHTDCGRSPTHWDIYNAMYSVCWFSLVCSDSVFRKFPTPSFQLHSCGLSHKEIPM